MTNTPTDRFHRYERYRGLPEVTVDYNKCMLLAPPDAIAQLLTDTFEYPVNRTMHGNMQKHGFKIDMLEDRGSLEIRNQLTPNIYRGDWFFWASYKLVSRTFCKGDGKFEFILSNDYFDGEATIEGTFFVGMDGSIYIDPDWSHPFHLKGTFCDQNLKLHWPDFYCGHARLPMPGYTPRGPFDASSEDEIVDLIESMILKGITPLGLVQGIPQFLIPNVENLQPEVLYRMYHNH